MGRRFFDQAWSFPWSESSVVSLLENMLSSGILLVSRDGMIGGLLVPFPYNQNILVAQELFWWVAPDSRGGGMALLDAFEDEAEMRGAGIVAMSLMEEMKGEVLSRIYERRGYKLNERSFLKVL